MSVTLDPTVPADSESPRQGASRIRSLTSENLQILGESGLVAVTYALPPFPTVDHTTGLVQVQGAPTAANGIANKAYVDAATTPQALSFTGVGSGTNTYTVTLSPVPANQAALAGIPIFVRIPNINTGASTLNPNALGALAIVKDGNSPLTGEELAPGGWAQFIYDSTNGNYQLINIAEEVSIFDRSLGNPAVDVVNTNVETSIYSKAVPGNTIGVDGALRITFAGDSLNNSGADSTIQFKVKFGGTTVIDSTAIPIQNNANRKTNRGSVIIANLGATNSQHVSATLFQGAVTTAAGGAATNGLMGFLANSSVGEFAGLAIDTTVAQTLQITVTLGATSPNFEYRNYQVWVEQIPA